MNALVPVGANFNGRLSATPQARSQVAGELSSLADAQITGLLRKAELIPKDTGVTTKGGIDNDLDRDAFLRLLVDQMRYQDPMDPVDNSQMIAQLAQFSALEQMNNLNNSFQELSGNIDQLNFISASGLVGRTVSGLDSSGELVQGVVDTVHLDGSMVYLNIDGQLLSMAGVVLIG